MKVSKTVCAAVSQEQSKELRAFDAVISSTPCIKEVFFSTCTLVYTFLYEAGLGG